MMAKFFGVVLLFYILLLYFEIPRVQRRIILYVVLLYNNIIFHTT
jgi:hypothetical protein